MTYPITSVALVALWPVLERTRRIWFTRGFVGLIMIGWALFNIVGGIVDHHLLKVHVVREDGSNLGVFFTGAS